MPAPLELLGNRFERLIAISKQVRKDMIEELNLQGARYTEGHGR